MIASVALDDDTQKRLNMMRLEITYFTHHNPRFKDDRSLNRALALISACMRQNSGIEPKELEPMWAEKVEAEIAYRGRK